MYVVAVAWTWSTKKVIWVVEEKGNETFQLCACAHVILHASTSGHNTCDEQKISFTYSSCFVWVCNIEFLFPLV